MTLQLPANALLLPHYGQAVWYQARGVDYEPEWYDQYFDFEGNLTSVGCVIYAFRSGSQLWSASTSVYPNTTILEAVRDARENVQRP